MFRKNLLYGSRTQTLLELENIILDPDIQARTQLNEEVLTDYIRSLKNGGHFPPITVFYLDDKKYYLVDGLHRYEAYRKAGFSEILCVVKGGSKRDAILHSVQSNATHGIRRSNADKRRAVGTLLKDDEWSKWSDRHIAKLCRVSQPFVSSMRKELSDNGYQFSEQRIGTKGWKIRTQNIGSTKKIKRLVSNDTEKPNNESGSDDLMALQEKISSLEEQLKQKNEKIVAYANQISALEIQVKHLEENHSGMLGQTV